MQRGTATGGSMRAQKFGIRACRGRPSLGLLACHSHSSVFGRSVVALPGRWGSGPRAGAARARGARRAGRRSGARGVSQNQFLQFDYIPFLAALSAARY